MLISEVARAAGVKVSSVRFYERRGLLAPARGGSGYREYDAADLDRIRVLRRGQELGFSLGELATLLSWARSPLSAELVRLGHEKLAQLDRAVTDLRNVQSALRAVLASADPDPNAACPITAALLGRGESSPSSGSDTEVSAAL